MLKPNDKIAIYMQDSLGKIDGKMGYGILKYSPNPVVAVIDSTQAGQSLPSFLQCERDCPIVSDIESAKALGADVMILGIAPSGGHLPAHWLQDLDRAIELGLSIVNGLHDPLASRYNALQENQWVWDIRLEPSTLPIASGKARHLTNQRVLFVGSDMAVGKMTAALELYRAARHAKHNTQFIATGQIGISIAGQGIPLDAIRLDYACGAVEQATLACESADLILIEGQGAINHPGSTATLPLMRGSCPTQLVLCHRANQTHLAKAPDIAIPSLSHLIDLYEELGAAAGTYQRPVTVGICLNTAGLSDTEAQTAINAVAEETKRPTWDVVRQGAHGLLKQLTTLQHSSQLNAD